MFHWFLAIFQQLNLQGQNMTLKKLLFYSITIAATTLILNAAAFAKPIVFVSIVPQKYFVEQIAGELLDVQVLVSPGANPHMYEPSPAQMASLSKAKAYFAIGINLENTWLPRINGTLPSLRMVYTQRGVKKIPIIDHGDHGDGHEGHDHGTLDPHIWLDPVRVKTIARNTCNGLIKADPANRASYETNLVKFLKELDKLNNDIIAIMAEVPSTQRAFLVFHPSWGYFAERYDLHQMPIESEGREPSPKELAGIIKEARTKDIKVIFVQPQISQRTARSIASQIDGRVEQLDPLSFNWRENLMNAAKAFKQNLQ